MDRDAVRRPVREEDLADQKLPGHGAPDAGVAGGLPVVAHHEVAVLPDLERLLRLVVAPVGLDVRLLQAPPVDVDEAAALRPHVAGQADDPLDEDAARAAELLRPLRRVEDDDLAPVRVAEVVDQPVGEHAVGEARLAAHARPRAVQRRLHRRGRDAVRVDDVELDREHDPDRARDGEDPVERDPRPAREAEAVERPPHRALRARLCSRRHSAIRAWSPERSTSGTRQPRNSAGRVYCGYSSPPASSPEKLSKAPDSSRIAPGSRRATASRTTIAGSSPPESTYGPIEIASEARCVTVRSSKPSERDESSVSRSSAASSSTTSCVSWRPCGVSATTRCCGTPP